MSSARLSWLKFGLIAPALLLFAAGPAAADEAAQIRQLQAQVAALTGKVQKLDDEAAIRDVLRRYARGLDRHDVALESSAFWPDAQVNYGFFSGSRDAFVEWGNATHAANYARHEHHITNQSVEIQGDKAEVESYVIFFLRGKDEQTTYIGGARYIDRMERRHGQWRIAVREFLPDIMIQANSVFAGKFAKLMCPPGGCGTWDKSDLSYVPALPRRSGPPTGQQQVAVPALAPPGEPK